MSAPRSKTVRMTNRPPIQFAKATWPKIAFARDSWHDGKVECQAHRIASAWVSVRVHADGRALVFGEASYSSAWQGEDGIDTYAGFIVPSADGERDIEGIIEAIGRVVAILAEVGPNLDYAKLERDAIAALPAEEV